MESEHCAAGGRDFVAVIERNAHHLLRIIDDVLDLSKVEAGKMTVERTTFSLSELLAEVSALMTARARDRGISFTMTIETSLPNVVASDPTRLRQILANVIGNAIKFTEQGEVHLMVRVDHFTLSFTVEDTGLGITAAQAESLFRPFAQAEVSTTRRFGGTGLGLTLTRQLTELMGGGFELVRSRPGVGSVFRAFVTVDTNPAAESGVRSGIPHAQESKSDHLRDLSVLVIEDSPDNQLLIQLMLAKLGVSVEIARDGVEGVDAAARGRHDVILCDVQMPRMDGYAVVKTLRARGDATPIIALTAHAMKDERDRALRAGFTGYLTKPIQKDALGRAIRGATLR